MQTVDDLCEALLAAAPEAADALEVAALSESLGVTDAQAVRFGYSNTFTLAADIFAVEYRDRGVALAPSAPQSHTRRFLEEAQRFASKAIIGLSYSLPWILLTLAETFFPHTLDVSPSFGSALSLAIIASLITTGGFVQMITRDATFFLSLREPFVARRMVFLLLRYGLLSTACFCVAGSLASLYFHLFSPHDLTIAAGQYVLFAALWMMCATLSAQGLSLLLPLILLGSGSCVLEARTLWHLNAVRVLVAWPAVALLSSLAVSGVQTWRVGRAVKGGAHHGSPAHGPHFYALLPVYLYGTAYFSFIFLDRLCAGSAVSWTSGLTFGVDPVYKRGMDIALLAFLLSSIVIEYLSDAFIRSWWERAGATRASNTERLSFTLHRRYLVFVSIVTAVFATLMLTAACFLPSALGLTSSRDLHEVLLFGGLGYLLLSTTLFGNIVLLSVNAVDEVVRAAGLALFVNFGVGYTLSHSVAAHLATVGLLAGSGAFAYKVHRSVWRVLEQPDYFYSLV